MTTASPPISDEMRRRARRTLLLVFLVCAAPIVLGTLAYFFWAPSGRTNYGQLLPLTPLKTTGTTPDGKPFDPAVLEGKWVLVVVDDDKPCDEACEKKLYFTRQVRTAQGRDQERVERLWLRTADVAVRPEAEPLVAGAFVVRADKPDALKALGPDATAHVFLMDPMGNVMLRFPADPDPKGMIKDLQKLLRVNNRVG